MKFVFDRSKRGWHPVNVPAAQTPRLTVTSEDLLLYHDYADHGGIHDFSWNGECRAVGAARWTKSGADDFFLLTTTDHKLADEGYRYAKTRWPNGISQCPDFQLNLNRLLIHFSQAIGVSQILRIPVIDRAYDIDVYDEDTVVRFRSPLIKWRDS